MSNKVFKQVTFDSKFDVNDDFITTVMNYAIPNAINDIDSYWKSKDAEKIITNATFGFIWKNYPDTRDELLNIAERVCNSTTRIESLTQDFCLKFVTDMYSLIKVNEDEEDNRLRIRLLPQVDKSFDYLSEMCKFALEEDKHKLYMIWHHAGMCSSTDSAFYDYVWSKVKREKGAVNTKLHILESAFDNSALSDNLLKKIAKSSPKNIKRSITNKFSREISDKKYRVKRLERDTKRESVALAAFVQKEVDALERKVMLFVDCTDREVVSNLLDCLSKDNLPWLMPSASGHYYLANRLQSMVDSSE